MTITKQTVADKIAAYLHHEITLGQLVDWSERALMDGELADTRFTLPLSGWYWQVTPPEGKGADLASASLLEQRLAPAPKDLAERDSDGIAHFYLTDANGTIKGSALPARLNQSSTMALPYLKRVVATE